MRRGLAAWQAGEDSPGVVAGQALAGTPKVAFLYPGQGVQSSGMARRLYETAPVFRAELDRCAEALAGELDRPLLDVVFPREGASSPIDETRYAQPALVAFQAALTALWRSWGIEPVLVMGHSLGELAAAHAAGMLSREDLLRSAVARGHLAHHLPGRGAMAVILAGADVVRAALAREGGAVAIAAFNGPANTVISGEREAVEHLVATLAGAGTDARMLRITFASHSPMVEPAVGPFGQVMSGLAWASPRTALVSNLTGDLARPGELASGDYWMRHMRQPVRFADSIRTLVAQGVTHCVEISPHPVLLGMGAECVPGSPAQWLPSLRRGQDDWQELFGSLQVLYCAGAPVDWGGVEAGTRRRRVSLPTYPFAGRRHWIETGPAEASVPAPVWDQVSSALDAQAAMGPLDLNASSYPAKWEALARLTAATAVRTFRDLGLFAAPGTRLTLDQVLAAGGIAGTYGRLVRRWLDRLVVDGALRHDGESFVADAPLQAPPLEALHRELALLFQDNQPLLRYIRHCEDLVPAVLSGRESPLETLFPGGSFDLAEGLYERSSTMQYVNALAARALGAVAASLPQGRELRVLEAGAGTGGTTGALLAVLPPGQARYLFTDVTDVFLDRAAGRLGGYRGIQFGKLDLDQDPAPQGFPAGSVDVVVAANSVHACRDLRQTLAWLRTLLAPGGVLLLVESTTHLAWFDMTTGLVEGWQHFADDLRTNDPLLSPEAWVKALREAGFDQADYWPRPGTPADHLGQHVLVAQATGAAAPAGAQPTVSAAAVSSSPGAASGPASPANAAATVAAALPHERLDILRDLVRRNVVAVLRYDRPEPPGRSERLMDLGFDSLMAVQLRNRLGQTLELAAPLPATLMFDYPTIDAIAAYLLARIEEVASVPEAAPGSAAPLEANVVAGLSEAEVEALLLDRLGEA